MDRDTKSEQQMGCETKRAAGNSSDREGAGWSRREFLTSSTGLAVAGAIGGLTGSASLAAREPAVRASSSHLSVHASAPGKPRRIIIDTDPGIDDAMAIFLALRSPELKV